MNKATVVEFVNTISEDDLVWLTSRLTEKLQNDMSEALSFMSKNKQMDSCLDSARNAKELYDFCDQIRDVLQGICKKKNL